MSLEPSDYSKFKGDCEKILNSYKSDDFITTTIRHQQFVDMLEDKDWFSS